MIAAAAHAQYDLAYLTGGAPGDRFGHAVVNTGDVDGDGTPDLAVGAPGQGGLGIVSVYSGATRALIRTLSLGFGVEFGHALANAGDVDGDGTPDLAVGDPTGPFTTSATGLVAVFSGATGAVIFTATGTGLGDRFGWSLAAVGDVNGDGVSDLAIGSPLADGAFTDEGRVDVLSGATGALIHSLAGTVAAAGLGVAVTGLGDADGDGVADYAVGAPGAILAMGPMSVVAPFTGRVTVVSGATGTAIFTHSELNTAAGFGAAIVPAGDRNADGVPDLAVAAGTTHPFGLGHVTVLSGTGSGPLLVLTPPANAPSCRTLTALSDVNADGVSDFAITCPETDPQVVGGAPGSVFINTLLTLPPPSSASTGPPNVLPIAALGIDQGTSLAEVGDLTGDGFNELAIGAPDAPTGGPGQVRIFGFGPPPLTIQAVAGTNQISTLGEPFPNPVVFRVSDAVGAPIVGQTVLLSSVAGTLSASSAITDTAGQVAVTATAGTVFGVGGTIITAKTVGTPLEGVSITLPVRALSAFRLPTVVIVQFRAGSPGAVVPIILAVDTPLPPPGFIPTVHGKVYTSIAAPGPSLAFLDGIGFSGPPNPALIANPQFMGTYPLTPAVLAALAGQTLVFQVYGLDLARPFPQNVFASNPSQLVF